MNRGVWQATVSCRVRHDLATKLQIYVAHLKCFPIYHLFNHHKNSEIGYHKYNPIIQMRELRFKGIVFENQVFKWLRESLFEVSFSHHLDTSCINEKLFPYSINKILAIASASFRPMKMSKSERQFSLYFQISEIYTIS